MFMGFHAAYNIHQRLLQTLPATHKSRTTSTSADEATNTTDEPEFKLFPEVPPMIAIAIGKTAIMLSPTDGTTSGKSVLEMMFRDDLGFASKSFYSTPLTPFHSLPIKVKYILTTLPFSMLELPPTRHRPRPRPTSRNHHRRRRARRNNQ